MRAQLLVVSLLVLCSVVPKALAQDSTDPDTTSTDLAPTDPSAWVEWSVSRFLAQNESRRRSASTLVIPAYPYAGDDEIEVAVAWCFVTHGARGEIGGMARLECMGATSYASTWRVELRGALGDRGIGHALGHVDHGVWRECIDAMVAAPRARVRRGEALEQYCLPRIQRALRVDR